MKGRLEWKVGLFVCIGLVLLAILLLQFSKGMTLFRSTYDLRLHAPNVGGLKSRSAVLMSGVQVGTVSDINLAPDGKSVTIILRIYANCTIHKDARFVIEQSGFLGDQFVAIVPTRNEGERFKHGDDAQAEPPFNLQEVARSVSGFVQRLDDTARKLNDSLAELRRLLLNPETLTNLASAVGNLRIASQKALQAVDGINLLVETNAGPISRSTTNLVHFSEQLNCFGERLSAVLATNEPVLNASLRNVEASTEMLKGVINDLQAGKGLAGSLVRNEELADAVSRTANNLSVTASNLSVTASNLNRLGLWGILWSRKQPHTNVASPRAVTSPKNASP
jgi:phospholipid/cholesterol/gamma-HCH transport system substrate-binding protein